MIIKGQITENSSLAIEIDNLIKNERPETVVEIGTWRGLGSTKRIIDSLSRYEIKANFISLEVNRQFYEEARVNLFEDLDKVTLFYGKITNNQSVIDFSAKYNLNQDQAGWLENDLRDMSFAPDVVLPDKIDILLLDGGEFSTYSEWKILKDRTKVVILDDTREIKCREIRSEIIESGEYQCLIDSEDRNGFSIFRKL